MWEMKVYPYRKSKVPKKWRGIIDQIQLLGASSRNSFIENDVVVIPACWNKEENEKILRLVLGEFRANLLIKAGIIYQTVGELTSHSGWYDIRIKIDWSTL